jgi:hypothetical protein
MDEFIALFLSVFIFLHQGFIPAWRQIIKAITCAYLSWQFIFVDIFPF